MECVQQPEQATQMQSEACEQPGFSGLHAPPASLPQSPIATSFPVLEGRVLWSPAMQPAAAHAVTYPATRDASTGHGAAQAWLPAPGSAHAALQYQALGAAEVLPRCAAAASQGNASYGSKPMQLAEKYAHAADQPVQQQELPGITSQAGLTIPVWAWHDNSMQGPPATAFHDSSGAIELDGVPAAGEMRPGFHAAPQRDGLMRPASMHSAAGFNPSTPKQ